MSLFAATVRINNYFQEIRDQPHDPGRVDFVYEQVLQTLDFIHDEGDQTDVISREWLRNVILNCHRTLSTFWNGEVD